MLRRLLLVAAVALAALATVSVSAAGVPGVAVVATYNVYQGTELEHVLGVTDPLLLPQAVGTDYANVVATNFNERAQALAAQIARTQAELVGLQEVATWSTGGFVSYNFLQILVNALAARGLHYAPVVVRTNFQAQAPGILPTGLTLVGLVEQTAILARTDLPTPLFSVANAQSHDFTLFTSIPFLGGTFPLGGGWASIDATVFGKKFRFVTAHLDPIIQAYRDAQMHQILVSNAGGPPLVVSGDLNSQVGTPAIGELGAAGFVDTWAATRPGNPGFTCCQVPPDTIVNPISKLSSRIDYVFTGPGTFPIFDLLLGADPSSRTDSGLWPSDHAGLAALIGIR